MRPGVLTRCANIAVSQHSIQYENPNETVFLFPLSLNVSAFFVNLCDWLPERMLGVI